jgi:hypothetical protein
MKTGPEPCETDRWCGTFDQGSDPYANTPVLVHPVAGHNRAEESTRGELVPRKDPLVEIEGHAGFLGQPVVAGKDPHTEAPLSPMKQMPRRPDSERSTLGF